MSSPERLEAPNGSGGCLFRHNGSPMSISLLYRATRTCVGTNERALIEGRAKQQNTTKQACLPHPPLSQPTPGLIPAFQDEAVFDAVVVTRTSPEGRMMTKWLNAARTKLGGVHLFPKPEAKAQMERRVTRSRSRKMTTQRSLQ